MFPPTFKYDPETGDFAIAKKRTPGWCDRILYRGKDIEQIFYTSCHSLSLSDHKPVTSLFNVTISSIVPEKMEEVKEKIVKELEELKAKAVPKLVLDKKDIVVSGVKYGDRKEVYVELKNEGEGILNFEIAKSREVPHSTHEWLKLSQTYGYVLPGSSLFLKLEVIINKEEARLIFDSPNTLQETLLLSTDETSSGQKYEIKLRCEGLPSCFGASLTALNQCLRSVREEMLENSPKSRRESLTSTPISPSNSIQKTSNDGLLPLPKEVYKMTNFLVKKGVKSEGIFTMTGDPQEMEKIREALDLNQEIDENADVYSVAECLIEFLQALSTPVLPKDIIDEGVITFESAAYVDDSICQKFFFRLPKPNFFLFIFILSFFKEMLNSSECNRLTPEKVVTILSDALIRKDEVEEIEPSSPDMSKRDSLFGVKIATSSLLQGYSHHRQRLRYQGFLYLFLDSK